MAKLSLAGIYGFDSHVLDGLLIPTGTMSYQDGTTITEPVADRDTLIENLLIDTYELELIYPDYSFLRAAIHSWCKTESNIWVEYWKTLHYKYNPIHNYDREEHGKDLETRDLKTTNDDTHDLNLTRVDTHNLQTTVNNTTNTDNTTTYSGNDTVSRTVAGYNSESLTNRDQDKTTYDSSDRLDGTVDSNGVSKDTGTLNVVTDDTGTLKRAGTDTGTVGNQHDFHAYGNIGVTTTQQLIKEQREIIDTSMYEFIIGRFKRRFCLEVYG